MLSLSYLFDGRLSRKEFWLGFFGIVVVTIAIGLALMALGLAETHTSTGYVQTDGGTPQEFTSVRSTLSPLPSFLLSLLMSIPALILGVRRRRDRNASGIDVVVITAISLLVQFLAVRGLADSLVTNLLDLVVFVGGLVLLILMGFLKGTVGPNKYGPDPLAGLPSPSVA